MLGDLTTQVYIVVLKRDLIPLITRMFYNGQDINNSLNLTILTQMIHYYHCLQRKYNIHEAHMF